MDWTEFQLESTRSSCCGLQVLLLVVTANFDLIHYGSQMELSEGRLTDMRQV